MTVTLVLANILKYLSEEDKILAFKMNVIHFTGLNIGSRRDIDLGWLPSNCLPLIGKAFGDRPEERIPDHRSTEFIF